MAFAWNIEESNATEIGAGHEYKSTPNGSRTRESVY